MIRLAEQTDVEAIVQLLADDELANLRERPENLIAYTHAFEQMRSDERILLAVAVDGSRIVGCIQVTFVRSLSYKGALRCLVEDVRVARDVRRRGTGRSLLAWAIAQANKRDCTLIELFMHRHRNEARRLYEATGFTNEHDGFRLMLNGS
jgi:GNAT superfamily N-acetyltransferase